MRVSSAMRTAIEERKGWVRPRPFRRCQSPAVSGSCGSKVTLSPRTPCPNATVRPRRSASWPGTVPRRVPKGRVATGLLTRRCPGFALLVQGRQVRVEQRVAPEEGDQRAEREEGAEGNAHLARLGAMAREEDEAGDHRGEQS